MPDESKTYELAAGEYVGNDKDGEVAFTVPAGGSFSTDDPRVMAVVEAQFLGNPELPEPEVHDETGAVVGAEAEPEPEPEPVAAEDEEE